MALSKYKKKRNASKTPEPFGGKSTDRGKLSFVVQKHAASHLHYDFRLEMEGVLKSWAVPKGPSTDPEIKRLAMMVEDHPFDYRTFEGIIPQGQYGGGTVIVWDEGTYEAVDFAGKSKKQQEKSLVNHLYKGKLKFILHGKKLKGEFALIKAPARGENAWLLMKLIDNYVSKDDITLKEKSVQSGQTIEKVKKTSENIYGHHHDKTLEKTRQSVTKNAKAIPNLVMVNRSLKMAPKAKMPAAIKPMLATMVDKPFDDPDWLFEVKWDGYRALSFINKGKVELRSRNNKSFTAKYYPLSDLLKKWKLNAVMDGEILVIDDNGVSDFSALQNWRSEADGQLVMYIFDLLWYQGKILMDLPLIDRQAILKDIFPDTDDRIRLSQVFAGEGKVFFEAARKLGLEGIIAKKSSSVYIPDSRSKEWLKIKAHQRQEVVIGGFTKNEGTAKYFSSLLLGVFENDTFQYVGKVGTGFSDKLQKQMIDKFKPLIIKESPFQTEPDVNKASRFRPNPPKAKATWLQPKLVCEVSFASITDEGVFRHPSFEGMREDKKAKEVVREANLPVEKVIKYENEKKQTLQPTRKEKLVRAPKGKTKRTLLNPAEETQIKIISGHELKFTNLSKVFWPDDNITKRDMFNYYYQVAEYILPYLKDRPQSLNRFPNGINGPSFYQKDVKNKSPQWVKTFPYTTSDGEHKEYLVGTDEATLLWMVSLACIEMNPWFSRIQSPDHPDYCVIDLDPDKNTFDQVIEAALETKKVLDEMKVPSFPKTSGSTGMHIYIPLAAEYTYDQSQSFARLIVTIVHERIPNFTSVERQVKNRKRKMYLDFLQNRPGATIACPYSLRPKRDATVSMPLDWSEVKPGLKVKHFTIRNSVERLKKEGDLFKEVLGKGIDMAKAIKIKS